MDKVGEKMMIDNTEYLKKMENMLTNYLSRGNGMFCLEDVAWKFGVVSMASFRAFLKQKVRFGTLLLQKDEFGREWYAAGEKDA